VNIAHNKIPAVLIAGKGLSYGEYVHNQQIRNSDVIRKDTPAAFSYKGQGRCSAG